MSRFSLLAAVALSLAVPGSAYATPPSADLRGTFAPLHAEGGLAMEPTDSPATGDVTGHARLSYGFRPVVLESQDVTAYEVIAHQFMADLGVNVGLFGRVTLGLDLPVLVGQIGDDLSVDPDAAALAGIRTVPIVSMGDPGIRAKVTIVKPDMVERVPHGFGLALDGRFTAPLGDEGSFIAEGEVTGMARLLADYGFGPVSAHVGAGVRLRAEEASFACRPPLADCASRFGHELPFYGAVALHPSELGIDPEGRFGVTLEAFGRMPLTPTSPTDSTLPWALSVGGTARWRAGDVAVLGGVHGSLLESVGVAPFSAMVGMSFAPRSSDIDDDGLPDDVDTCPTWSEDRDGFEDSDGCPETDNDLDGVPDPMDDCPGVPGTPATRGCS
jgi:OmpA-OmpF porin, OOP family